MDIKLATEALSPEHQEIVCKCLQGSTLETTEYWFRFWLHGNLQLDGDFTVEELRLLANTLEALQLS